MSTLDSLIRINRWQLDEKRRHLADLEALAARLRDEQRRLDDEEKREQAAATASPEAAFAYAGYAQALVERRRKLMQSLAEVAQQITAAHEALAEAFQEMKRYEITAASRARQAELGERRREQGVLDELGVEGFRRRASGTN